jgi:2-C-methyl-D-erythritol 4-phosphate cytidylyltransferase/2-C-methyl-D-erythritol 2,4-cyclodiphosphate synthase
MGQAAIPKVGFGFDIHRLVAGRPLWLAGIKIEHSKGLLGHSDGDAVLHAACDAILGALAQGEIGQMFPPDNPKIKDIPSREIVAAVLKKLSAAGGVFSHLDITLVAEEPKLKPHYEAFKRSLCALFGLKDSQLNIKAKSNEGLDSIGRGEAIACHAVATILSFS